MQSAGQKELARVSLPALQLAAETPLSATLNISPVVSDPCVQGAFRCAVGLSINPADAESIGLRCVCACSEHVLFPLGSGLLI